MRYGLLRWPIGVRSLVAGLIWGLGMFAWPFRDAADRTGTTLLISVVFGLIFGGAMYLAVGRRERDAFAVDGRPLTGDERVTVVRAVDDVEPPAQARLREVATGVARRRAAESRSSVAIGFVVFGLMLALSVFLAISGSPWWWAAAGLWAVLIAYTAIVEPRRKAAARRYLKAAGPETLVSSDT
jgi:O-antigen/teichoic acid export membrane protein